MLVKVVKCSNTLNLKLNIDLPRRVLHFRISKKSGISLIKICENVGSAETQSNCLIYTPVQGGLKGLKVTFAARFLAVKIGG